MTADKTRLHAISAYQNFEQFVMDYYHNGYIELVGDELRIDPMVLERAWEWLSARYKREDGEECLEFLADHIFDNFESGWIGKLMVSALHEKDPQSLMTTMAMIRNDYCMRAIEHYKKDIARADRREGPDPMDIRKDRLERVA